jgi:hypothetical protein
MPMLTIHLMRMDGFADIYSICTHFDRQGNLANHVVRMCANHTASQDFAVAVGFG